MRDLGPARNHFATSAVGAWLSRQWPGITPLSSEELNLYPGRGVIAGWRLTIAFPDGVRRLDLLAHQRFPREAPLVALVDRPAFLTWPHVEKDGVLCLLPRGAETDPFHPEQVVAHVLAAASQLVEDLAAGRRTQDFRDEFHSYWGWDVSKGLPRFLSLLDTKPPTRRVVVWRGRRACVVGEDERTVLAWLRHRYPQDAADPQLEPAVLLWLDQPIVPNEFPRTAANVGRIARAADGDSILEDLAGSRPAQILVILAAPTVNGPCLGAVIVWPDAMDFTFARGSGLVVNGFRPGKAPRRLIVQKYLGGAQVMRASVDRIDASWVHGRDQDQRLAKLRGATVTVLGCGSVGPPSPSCSPKQE